MAYNGSWAIDDVYTFDCTTHDAATGAATDADSAPSYRVYEDETATPLLTGSMALLDSSNTVGFYTEQITLSAANGFEVGKCYTVYIEAAVDSVTGTTTRKFQVGAKVNTTLIEGSDATNQIRDAVVDDATRIDASALNTLSSHDPGETIMGATDSVTVGTNNDKTGYGLADDAITAAKFDESTAFPLASADSGSTAVARTGADGDTLETLSDQIDGVGGGSNPFTIASGTIGSTGNTTTTLHLDGLTQGDDELNDLLIVVYDDSTGEYHSRWILDWVLSTELATVAALPFTPEDATDTYAVLGVRQDVTGGSGLDAAGVRAAIGMASADLDTQLDAIKSDTAAILDDTGTTGVVIVDDGITASKFDESTAFPIKFADASSTLICRANGTVGGVTGNVAGSVGSLGATAQANVRTAVGLSSANLDTQLGAIVADTNELQADWTDGGRLDLLLDDVPTVAEFEARTIVAASYSTVTTAQVNAEVVDALNTDTYAEPGQGTPSATLSLVAKIGYLFKAWRNKSTQTSSEYALYADDGTTKDQEAGVSDDGTTFTRNEIQTGA